MTHINPVNLMALPFAECLVLVGIHSYLGLHVIKRQVIFVDLSLAQIAALGTTVAFLFGIHPHTLGSFLFSLSFTFIGAAIFALTRTKRARVPQEAIIGIVYALAAALGILIIDKAPHGAEHIKEMLTGSILWVRPHEVLRAAIAYSLVGIFHYIFREKFITISNNPELAIERGYNIALWDLLFYMSFGFVITFSVNTAGVLLVFVFLVVPAVIAVSLTDRFLWQLLIGWGLGTLVSIIGLALSYYLDLPSGPAVVSFYGLILLLVGLTMYVVRHENRVLAIKRLVIGLGVLLLVIMYFWGLKEFIMMRPAWAHGENAEVEATIKEQKQEQAQIQKEIKHNRVERLLIKLKGLDIDAKSAYLKKIKDANLLKKAFAKCKQTDGSCTLAQMAARINTSIGAKLLYTFVSNNKNPLFQKIEAATALGKLCHQDFSNIDPTSEQDLQKLKQCMQSIVGAK